MALILVGTILCLAGVAVVTRDRGRWSRSAIVLLIVGVVSLAVGGVEWFTRYWRR